MDKQTFTLPPAEEGIGTLNRLDPASREEFFDALLVSLWDAHKTGELPDSITLTLLDWLAHIAFWESPVFQERLGAARRAANLSEGI